MPVDPQIQGMLDLLARLDAPPLSSQAPQAAREGFEQMTVGMRVPEMLTPVASTRDVTVPGPGRSRCTPASTGPRRRTRRLAADRAVHPRRRLRDRQRRDA